PKGYAFALHERVIPAFGGAWIDGPASLRWFRDAIMNYQVKVHGDEGKQNRGNKEHVGGKEAAERGAAGCRARQDEVAQPVSDQRRTARLFGGNNSSPKATLVPAQDLACKRHEQRSKQQHDAGKPTDLPRIFVCG